MMPTVLLVDDDPAILRGFARFLKAAGYRVSEATSLEEAGRLVTSRRFDAVILDQYLPDGRGIDWIPDLREEHPGLAIILVTGEGDIPTAVEAMRRGGDNFLTKPVNMQELDVFLKKSLELGTLRQRELVRHRMEGKADRYWGESAAMREVMELARLAAENESPVLIQGETGTGKGMLSRWIHDHSAHGDTEMVEVNCSGLRGELLASELFGHVKGAFTTAVKSRAGLLEVADGATLFLDEIGDMNIEVQAQFLKAIEEKRFRPLGESRERRSDFRLICATNQDLEEKKRAGSFREDLFFRINVFPVHLPPLRKRMEDLPGMIGTMLRDFGLPDVEVAPASRTILESYPWPGNLRELRNIIERALILSRGGRIEPAHIPALNSAPPAPAGRQRRGRAPCGEEKTQILEAVERAGGDKKKAAVLLDMSPATLYRKLHRIREDSQGDRQME
jgi:DNA-binding NtrC family response regulator